MSVRLAAFHARHDEGWHTRALDELRSGRRQTRWIWWTFPQLDGLGRSKSSQLYGLSGPDDARVYLQDPILHARLVEVVEAVVEQVDAGRSLVQLMGSIVDARKVVSSVALFAEVAVDSGAAGASLAAAAARVLDAAAEEGVGTCGVTGGCA